MAASSCTALRYPRRFERVLEPSDRSLLSDLYWRRVHQQRFPITYFNLLHALVDRATPSAEYEALQAVLARVQRRIKSELGDRFVVINDFFSFRSADRRLFPGWHQDYEFWLTGGIAAGTRTLLSPPAFD